jgi:hypothetical protein
MKMMIGREIFLKVFQRANFGLVMRLMMEMNELHEQNG